MKSKAHGKRCPEGTTPGPVLSEPDAEEGGAYLSNYHSKMYKSVLKEKGKKRKLCCASSCRWYGGKLRCIRGR